MYFLIFLIEEMNKIFHQKIPILSAVCLILSLTISAQNKRILGLEEAVSLGILQSKQLKTDSISLLLTDAKMAQVRNPMLPQVSANLSYIRLSDNITPFRVAFPTGDVTLNPQILNQSYNALQVRQLIWAGNRVKLAGELLALDKKATQADMQKTKVDIAYTITNLWYTLFTVRQSEKLLKTNVELLTKQKLDAQNLANQGVLLENDVLKIDLAITTLQSNLSDIAYTQTLLKYNLCVLTGLDTEASVDIPDELPPSTAQVDGLEQYLQNAFKNRSELRGLDVRKEQANVGMKLTQQNTLPTLSAGGSVNVDLPNQRLFPNEAKFTPTWNIGVFFNWNLTDIYTNKEKMRESGLAISKLNSAFEQAKQGITLEVNTDYNNYLQAKQKIQLAQKAVSQATENFKVEENKFKSQTTTATEFLNANTLLIQSQINLTTAVANAELAYRKLLKSTN
jgi:outer membrane protein